MSNIARVSPSLICNSFGKLSTHGYEPPPPLALGSDPTVRPGNRPVVIPVINGYRYISIANIDRLVHLIMSSFEKLIARGAPPTRPHDNRTRRVDPSARIHTRWRRKIYRQVDTRIRARAGRASAFIHTCVLACLRTTRLRGRSRRNRRGGKGGGEEGVGAISSTC